MDRLLADLFHTVQIKEIHIMRIVLIQRMISIDDRDMQIMSQYASEDPHGEFLLDMDDIQMQVFHFFFHLKMIRRAQRIAIQLFQLYPGHADHIAFPMRMQRILLSRHDIYLVAGRFQSFLQRHYRGNDPVDIRCICIRKNTDPHHSTSSF